jgi:hypothetical protein
MIPVPMFSFYVFYFWFCTPASNAENMVEVNAAKGGTTSY